MLTLLLINSIGIAQNKFTTETQVKEAVNNLHRTTSSSEKVTTILQLSDWYLIKNERTSQELEQSYKLAKEGNALSIQLKDAHGQAASYLQLSKIEQARNNLDEGQRLAQKAIDLFTALQSYDQLGESYVSLWSIYTAKGMEIPDRIKILQQADTAFKASGNSKRRADCLVQVADLNQVTGDFATSLSNLQESLQLYKDAGYKFLQASYDLLATVYYSLGDYKTSIEYGLLAEKTAEQTGDTSLMICTIYNHIGMAYHGLNNFGKAKDYFEQSLDVALKYNDIGSIHILATNLSYVLTLLPDPREALKFLISLRKRYPLLDTRFPERMANTMIIIYTSMHTPEKAVAFCKIVEAKLAHRDGQNYETDLDMSRALVLHYIQLGNTIKAARYAALYDSLCRRLNTRIYYTNNYYCKFLVDSAQGHYFSALNNFKHYTYLKDSVSRERKSREISQLNVLYETEKKDKNIHLLQQQTALQESRIRQEKVIRNFSLAGAVMLVLVAFLIYRAYKTKQKNNQVLQAHQAEIQEKNESLQRLVTEKEWLVKEIHHRVKNNLHMVVGLLASQAEFIKGKEALDAINQSQHRIHTMSLIHQRLYQAENLSSIDMPSYVHELVDYLKSSFDRASSIHFMLDIARVSFPLSYSIPIGLILNEAVTNALKYAFPAGEGGEISIRLKEAAGEHFTLHIHDNGIGLPANLRAVSNNTLGITLMTGLSEDIGARFEMRSEQGTKIDIDFLLRKQ
jgi:two-component sensor histidine kinase